VDADGAVALGAWCVGVGQVGFEESQDAASDGFDRSYTQKLWMRVKRKAAYLPG
jgi:hypothetical protein